MFKKIAKAVTSPGAIASTALGGGLGLMGYGAVRGAQELADKAARETPQRQVVGMDAGTQGLMEQQAAQARKTPDQIAAEQTAGIGEYGSMTQNLPQPAGLAGIGSDDLDAALSKRVGERFKDDTEYIRRAAKFDAPSSMLRQGERAQSFAQAQAQNQLQNFKAQLDNRLAQRQARSQMIAQLSGAAGAIGGLALGGPMGAKAGSTAMGGGGKA